jgi:hypothetical protein
VPLLQLFPDCGKLKILALGRPPKAKFFSPLLACYLGSSKVDTYKHLIPYVACVLDLVFRIETQTGGTAEGDWL